MIQQNIAVSFLLFFFVLFVESDVLANEFMSIPWGSSQEHVKSVLLAREGATFDYINSDESMVTIDGGRFAGRPIDWITVLFFENQMCQAAVYVTPKKHKVINEYKEWVKRFSDKYGEPDKKYEFFKKPYFEGDGYPEQAIKNGKGFYASFWNLYRISVKISDYLKIVIKYENEALMDKFVKKKRLKDDSEL